MVQSCVVRLINTVDIFTSGDCFRQLEAVLITKMIDYPRNDDHCDFWHSHLLKVTVFGEQPKRRHLVQTLDKRSFKPCIMYQSYTNMESLLYTQGRWEKERYSALFYLYQVIYFLSEGISKLFLQIVFDAYQPAAALWKTKTWKQLKPATILKQNRMLRNDRLFALWKTQAHCQQGRITWLWAFLVMSWVFTENTALPMIAELFFLHLFYINLRSVSKHCKELNNQFSAPNIRLTKKQSSSCCELC